VKTYFFISFAVFCLFINTSVVGQNPKNKFKKGGIVKLQDSLTSYSQSDIFDFPNVNKIKRYHNEEKLKKLKQYEASYADEELYPALREYVKNFGIENFTANTSLIWKLAKLSEKYGPPGEALLLYKMVLKHNTRDVDGKLVQSEYDSISKNEKDNYVPLDYYYELVNYRKEIDTLQPPHGVLLNMGDWINSPKADYAPTIGNKDSILLFTSKRNSNFRSFDKSYNEDLFFTKKFYGNWEEAQPFKTINTSSNEGSACLSHDGRYLYFARCNSPDT
jgi:hypothetical protein